MEIIIPLYFVPEGGTSCLTGCSVDLGLLSWVVGMRLDNYGGFHLALPPLMALTMSGNQWEDSASYFVYLFILCLWGMGELTTK